MHSEPGPLETILVVADDLTGALDTAGTFATLRHPVEVPLGPHGLAAGRIAIDTDSRDLDEACAVDRVIDVFGSARQGAHQLRFKKIDSVMRGHPITEGVAAYRAGGFDRALLAPAFPIAGRITHGGQQYVLSGTDREPVGPSLVSALRSHGVMAELLDEFDPGGGTADFLVADATTPADLSAAAARVRRLPGNTLYVGSAGLAAALSCAGQQAVAVPPLDMAISGTAHPVTRRQFEAVRRAGIKVRALDGGTIHGADGPAFCPAEETVTEDYARSTILRSLAALLNEIPAPRNCFVTGGWTLRAVLKEVGAERLRCIGLHTPGVPVCEVIGGRWHGTWVISKSGGFGAPDLVAHLFAGSTGEGA